MDKKQEFLEIVAKYCDKDASEITDWRIPLMWSWKRKKPFVLRPSARLWNI